MSSSDMTTDAYRLVPWTRVARPHDDVTGGALDMGTYAANLARVFRGAEGLPAVYRDPERFFATTYLTNGLQELLADALGTLSEKPGDSVLQLRTPFGGGKTHTLVALLHLARDPEASRRSLGAAVAAELPDPGPIQVAVLSGEELDPLSSQASTGTETHTLWGELAAQLGRYDLVDQHDRSGAAPGGSVLAQVLGPGPVLVLLDEVLVYVEKAMAVSRGESNAGRQAMLFVQALTEAVNGHPRAAMVYSLQASVGEAVGAEGLLTQLDHLVSRIDAKREPVTGDEVMKVVQRRLFADLGDESVRRQVAAVYSDLVGRQLRAQADTDDDRREADVEAERLQSRILEAYPFHPDLLDLMYHRWGSLPSYQRTRGALQFLASVTHALWHRGDQHALIGPGEVDLDDGPTRGAFFSQVGERERYTSVIDGDVVSEGSGAKIVDRRIGTDSPGLAQLKVGTRTATAIMLFSFGARQGEDRGVLESDLVRATLVPGLDRNVIAAALHYLRDEELYMHYTGRRYRFEPTPNLTKLVRDEANRLPPESVLAEVKIELEKSFELALKDRRAGIRDVVLWPQSGETIPDHRPRFTLAYLHPDWSPEQLPLEMLADLVETAKGGKRTYKNALGFVLPDTLVFDRARAASRLKLSVESLLGRKAKLGFTNEQVEELREKASTAQRDLTSAVGSSYSQVVLPVKGDGVGPFSLEAIDLRSMLAAGRSLHERVVEAVSHRVFDRITVDKLASLAGLGNARPAVSCADLVSWFFKYFEFTKLTDAAALADAVSRGVMDGRFAYATDVTIGADGLPSLADPRRLRFREMLPADEVDLGQDAALLTPEAAATFLPPPVGPATRPDNEADIDESGKVSGATLRAGPGLAPDHDPASGTAARPGKRAGLLVLRAAVSAPGLFGLQRALVWLREHSSSVEVEVTVRATGIGEGFDVVALRNGVVEPLEEAGGNPDVELR